MTLPSPLLRSARALLLGGVLGLSARTETVRAETVRAETVREAFPPPTGAQRVPGDAFGEWLGELRLRAPDVPVRTWDGRVVPDTARVIELPLSPGDLQQCADTILRLRATWQRAQGQSPSFRATSGDPIPYDRFVRGERPRAEGNRLVWSAGGRTGDGEETFEQYLRAVFTWAGTRSLEAYETVPAQAPAPGRILVQGGSPGHAVILLDVATTAEGQVYLLVGEGFMPAQDAHVQLGPVQGWWPWDPREGLALPYWPLPASSLRRFKD